MALPVALSAAVVVGPCRARAQRVVDALCGQTVQGSIEIIVIDLAQASVPRLEVHPAARLTYLRQARELRWGEARALAVQAAHAPVIAFVEDHCRTGRPYCRLLAAHRADLRGWGAPRRLLYGILTPASAPVLRLLRLANSLRARPSLWPGFLAGLPAIVAMYVSDATGESAGYLFGAGDSKRDVLKYELETERDS